MAKRQLDSDTWSEIRGHLSVLKPDSKPAWGSLNASGLLAHLNATILLSLNELPGVEDKSTWFLRKLFVPIFHHLPMPRNVKAPAEFTPAPTEDNLDNLLNILDTNVARFIQAAEANPQQIGISPMFGPIPMWQWRFIQYNHFQHHLKQFRLTPSARS